MQKRGVKLIDVVGWRYPDVDEPSQLIRAGRVSVNGCLLTNPSSVVHPGSSIVVAKPTLLRGEAKLRAALDAFRVIIHNRVALDVGAAAGGFTRVLLESGARRVYSVDAGHGQLLGSLRQDERVVNLEATNLASLNRGLVPDTIDVVTMDLSYLSVAAAVPQLESVNLSPRADLVALVKPMFELQLPSPPQDRPSLEEALNRAVAGIEANGWRRVESMESPVRGARGAIEFLVHARQG